MKTKAITVVPNTAGFATPYSAKDCVGTIMTFTGLGWYSESSVISGVKLTDIDDNAVEYDIMLFSSSPTGTFTDNAAVDPTDADLANLLPIINLATTDHFSLNDNGVSTLSSLSSVVLPPSTDASILYVVLVTRGTPTYSSATSLALTLITEPRF